VGGSEVVLKEHQSTGKKNFNIFKFSGTQA
jgi:hypothetical protein